MGITMQDPLTAKLYNTLLDRALLFRRQEPDAMRAEDIVQEAGVASVGDPGTKMALALRAFKPLETAGLIERTKVAEQLAYRLTRLGEREALLAKVDTLRLRIADVERHEEELGVELRSRERALRVVRDEVEYLRKENQRLVREGRPWWKKLFNGKDEGGIDE